MTPPLFSIVIPTYNRSELVQGAVRSVLAQTVDDFEVVVSDNCSHDDTREVIQGFQDPRVRYVRTLEHGVIGESWEFARAQARGRLIMMLSDDDALVPNALARFAEAHRRHAADFLFCNLSEYFDRAFPGPQQNTVACRAFSGRTSVVSTDDFVRPLFAFRPKFEMHPSAFMFAASVAERVVQRSGRFFRTNGVEYFAWPLAAVFAKSLVYVDLPMVILGRTPKSWGSAIVLSNPGKEQIEKLIADVAHNREWIPLTNFTLCNLMAEGMLLAQQMFPDELRPFPFDEQYYLRRTMYELRRRHEMGVDVGREMAEWLAYAEKYPPLTAEYRTLPMNGAIGRDSAVRQFARRIGLNLITRRFEAFKLARRIKRGDVKSGFVASGGAFGFSDAQGCANFVSRVTGQ
ncbi:MAG: glycosyltransferase family A protein [Acidobacteriota bacterium]